MTGFIQRTSNTFETFYLQIFEIVFVNKLGNV